MGRVCTQVKSQSWRVRFVSEDAENTAETRGHPADPHRALWCNTADTRATQTLRTVNIRVVYKEFFSSQPFVLFGCQGSDTGAISDWKCIFNFF